MSTIEKINTVEPYVLLRASLALFEKTPDDLDDVQKKQAITQAKKEQDIESLILSSPEAAKFVVSESELNKAFNEIKARFESEENFHQALSHNGLTIDALTSALQRQCKVENVMELVASRAATVSEVETGVYYYMHPEKFRRDEHRSAKHILITINEDFPDNRRKKAWERIKLVAQTLRKQPTKFADLALRYSECPTSLEEGNLGTVPKGRLFPELDEALFKLEEGQISNVIETEVGFHILLCTEIHPPQEMTLVEAQPQIEKLMNERARRTCQRAWLAELSANH